MWISLFFFNHYTDQFIFTALQKEFKVKPVGLFKQVCKLISQSSVSNQKYHFSINSSVWNVLFCSNCTVFCSCSKQTQAGSDKPFPPVPPSLLESPVTNRVECNMSEGSSVRARLFVVGCQVAANTTRKSEILVTVLSFFVLIHERGAGLSS